MTKLKTDTDVLIVGAGPTGLVMACELARRNISLRIVDKAEKPSDKSRALAIHARSMEFFQKLGLVEKFLAVGQKTLGLKIIVDGKAKQTFDFGTLGELDTPFPFILMLSQERTEKILTEHLSSLGVTIERGLTLKHFSQTDESVSSTVLRLSDGSEETIESRYIVGADGAHSVVRHQLGLRFEGAPYEQEFMLADVRMTNWPHSYDEFEICLTTDGLMAVFPLEGEALSRLIITRRQFAKLSPSAGATSTEPVTLKEVEQAAKALSCADVTLSDPRWLANFRLHHRQVDRYALGRAFVAGDAAHIHSPAGGQGMNTGIQDSFNLAWKLALVLNSKSSSDILGTYHQERHPVGQWLLRTTDRMFAVMATRRYMVLWLRNKLVPTIAGLVLGGPAWIREKMFRFLGQLSIRYSENRYIGVGGGRRAPDVRLGEATLFARMCHTGFTLLCFDRDAPKFPGDSNPEIIRLFKSRDPTAFERYGINVSGFVLIRPDGYVAWRGQSLDKLTKFWTSRFSLVS